MSESDFEPCFHCITIYVSRLVALTKLLESGTYRPALQLLAELAKLAAVLEFEYLDAEALPEMTAVAAELNRALEDPELEMQQLTALVQRLEHAYKVALP